MSSKIFVAKSGLKNAGRGVFASGPIKKGAVIEVCPILILEGKDSTNVMKTQLQNYVFEYTKTSVLMALGNGSLYNHSKTPNAMYELIVYDGMQEQDNELCFTAIKPILPNEEIFIDYGINHHQKYHVKG